MVCIFKNKLQSTSIQGHEDNPVEASIPGECIFIIYIILIIHRICFTVHKYNTQNNSLGKLMATFSPLLSRIFLDKVLNLGWPGNMASSGKNSDLVAPSFGVGFTGGSVKFSQPNLKKIALDY